MDFGKALEELRNGKFVQRIDWGNSYIQLRNIHSKTYYCSYSHFRYLTPQEDGLYDVNVWTPTVRDILAFDWAVYEPEQDEEDLDE